ncbi:hypothetical protein K2V52_03265 [Staphylococcus nepalensis]|uniref:hypothetical protein n=1 Tax=Staphylococcus nepalensis TaxID=214473 RepID=UPI001E57CAE5|nr:hypothetical protein [Staphylococcus nepalensis]MCD8890981.1 hypothetical protein [Staphylococcus nepalensis]
MSYEEIWKKATKEVARERDCLNDKLNQAYEDGYQMEGKYRDMKTQRDSLIDDIAVLKVNISRLERENEKLKSGKENLTNRVRNLDLHLQIQHDELMSCDGEVRYWKEKYTTLTNHIRDMKFASPYSYNYIHLVNFIKELERADDER